MDMLSPRQNKILVLAGREGRVDVEKLSSIFDISPQTIRKDLNILCDRQILQRVHGGAIVGSGIENVSYEARRLLAPGSKKAIGEMAATLIPDNSSLLINIGTTTEQVAHSLKDHRGLLVITNNINVASMLWPARGLEVMIAGGAIRRSDGGIVGSSAKEFIDNFRVDYAIIGCSAIDNDGDFFDYDLREVRVTRAIIEHARSVILVTDSMKFERRAPIRIGNIDSIGTLVTDDGIPADTIQLCQQHGVDLEIVTQGRPGNWATGSS